MRTKLSTYPKQFIHGDVNQYNIIVSNVPYTPDFGIIDFNDLTVSYRVFELAHLIAYTLSGQNFNYEVCEPVVKYSLETTTFYLMYIMYTLYAI